MIFHCARRDPLQPRKQRVLRHRPPHNNLIALVCALREHRRSTGHLPLSYRAPSASTETMPAASATPMLLPNLFVAFSRTSGHPSTRPYCYVCFTRSVTSSVLTNHMMRLERERRLRSHTQSVCIAGCSERPSSKAAASEVANRTLCRTLSL